MGKLGTMLQVARTFGAREGMLRLEYELQRGSGLMARRMQSVAGWGLWQLERIAPHTSIVKIINARRIGQRPFFFQTARNLAGDLKAILGSRGEEIALAEADKILAGTFPYFGRLNFSCGFPPRWFQNPVTGQSVSPDRPWTRMRFADPEYGDLKFILEPSRFLFVYPLARAYSISGEERFAEAFWASLEDWAEQNPPMSGPLWICGQESSLRIMSWSFALYAFLEARGTTPQRVELLLSMVAAHAWRAAQTLGYARSQRSNHLISEAVGLWTTGTLFPELKDARVWLQQGDEALLEAVIDQISPAGVLFQNSFNYQRMVLQQLLWVIRLDELNSQNVNPAIRDRAAAALAFMEPFVDEKSGQAPNHGSNDGSYILPIAQSDFVDYRPLIALGRCVLGQSKKLPEGPWDEAALWIGAKNSPPAKQDGVGDRLPGEVSTTGFHRLGTKNSWALVRAGRLARRPFQADQLHVDLWWNGINLARDAGSYLYNGDPPWDNGLAGTQVHNTVTIDGKDQMRRAGRFLWLDWAQASGKSFSSSITPSHAHVIDSFEGSHDGYRKVGITHHRKVHFVGENAWVVVDDVLGPGEHNLQLHWLLPDLPLEVISKAPFAATLVSGRQRFQWKIFSSSPGSASVIRAGKNFPEQSAGLSKGMEVLGYESPTYGELNPAISILYSVKASLPSRMVTVILVGGEVQDEVQDQVQDKVQLDLNGEVLSLNRDGAQVYHVNLSSAPSSAQAESVRR